MKFRKIGCTSIKKLSTFLANISTNRQKTNVLVDKIKKSYPHFKNLCGYLFLSRKTVDKRPQKGYNIKMSSLKTTRRKYRRAPVAQLDRALVYGTKG